MVKKKNKIINVGGKGETDYSTNLKVLCDWLVTTQEPDGKLPGLYFENSYAVRALLAASEIMDNEQYKRSAFKWCDFIVSQQREDGGWWVGYDTKDEVYLGDDGTIALGLACSFLYAKKDRKKELLTVLRKYAEFAQTWLLESGGFGLGYTHYDYFNKQDMQTKTARDLGVAKAERREFSTAGATNTAFFTALYGITNKKCYLDIAELGARRILEKGWNSVSPTSGTIYAEEALAWVYNLSQDTQLQKKIRDDFYILTTLIVKREWWIEGNAREALHLQFLTWYCNNIIKSSDVVSSVERGLKHFCSSTSDWNIEKMIASLGNKTKNVTAEDVLSDSRSDSEKRRYLNFLSTGLAEQLRTNITFMVKE